MHPLTIAVVVSLLAFHAHAKCPLGHDAVISSDSILSNDPPRSLLASKVSPGADFNKVAADVEKVLNDPKSFWPVDFSNYGGLFIRLSWHCAGSYRGFDGRGGCDGARIRFNPELSWPDNTNLDKARRLLEPVKAKYGDALSWGDLIIVAGNTAIKSMGGPLLGFCGGRVDDKDGSDSLPLGPNKEQDAITPCADNGACKWPLGPTTLGLIYVNPEGPKGVPEPKLSAPQIREVFGRMGMNDIETVALIGGGHAFGKAHGACSTGAGPNPTESPKDPWPGTCGTGPLKGKGSNAFTSGFEGPWTTTPTKWSNQYFTNLLEFDWVKVKSPAGHNQWQPKHKNGTKEPLPAIVMLTADVALLHDAAYLKIVELFARDIKALEKTFAAAWYKLVTRDMGPRARCKGTDIPPAQPFQCELPPPPKNLPDFSKVSADIKKALTTKSAALQPDAVKGGAYYGALFTALTWSCASTFRRTDYRGGCNGARIRFAPWKTLPSNAGLTAVLKVLQPIKDKYQGLTYADLIVLAGNVAIEEAAGVKLKFWGGRSDAKSACDADAELAPRKYPTAVTEVLDNANVRGLTLREEVALFAQLRSPSQQQRLGYSGSWTSDPTTLSNEFFTMLLSEKWEKSKSAKGKTEYKSGSKYITPTDYALKQDSQLSAIVKEFASNNAAFMTAFTSAWTKLTSADLY